VNLEDNPASKDLTGTTKTSADEKETKLDAAFYAALKQIWSSRVRSA